ncbi:MAG: YciK family oxidoreductase [Pseudomonadota bacterium]|nr:YciK family oxidoreductase [Pseudomonadota bacterium]
MFAYTPRPDLLAGKTILVTGAGSGLGRAAALSYAKHGATVLLLGRKLEKLEATYDAIEAAGGPEPALMTLDFETAREPEYDEVAQIVANEFGKLDGLLHSAGVAAPIVPLQFVTLTNWNKLLQVNLTAAFALTRACIPVLQQAAQASLIFTSAKAGREMRAFGGPYAIAKHGVEALMEIFHQELATTSRIRVNSLNPGPCATALRKVVFPAEDPTTLPQPEALMPLYLYLMGDDSLHENGRRFDAQ